MKKLLLLIYMCLILASLSACGSPNMSDEEILQAAAKILEQQENKQSDSSIAEDSITTRDTVTAEDIGTTEPTLRPTIAPVSVIGTRKNPARIGDSLFGVLDSVVYGKCEYEIKLIDIIKGKDAWNIIKKGNRFNSEPENGKEYIMAKFYVKNLKDYSGEDQPLEINPAQFNYANSQDIIEDQFVSIAGVDSTLYCNLYEGVEYEGWVFLLANVDEESPKAVFLDELWFDLRSYS